MSNIVHGKDIQIYRATPIPGEQGYPKLVACAKSCDIIVSADIIEVCTEDESVWRQFIAGRKDWQVTVNYLVTAMPSDIPQVGDSVELLISQTGAPPLHGEAICEKCRITATLGNLAVGAFTFQGTGELSVTS